MRILVCGSRKWEDQEIVDRVLDGYWNADPDSVFTLIEGGGRGADAHAADWMQRHVEFGYLEHEQYPAEWATHGKAAGPIRNQQMLDEGKPDVVVAFKDGFARDDQGPEGTGRWHRAGGTEDMVRRAKAAGIPVYLVSHA